MFSHFWQFGVQSAGFRSFTHVPLISFNQKGQLFQHAYRPEINGTLTNPWSHLSHDVQVERLEGEHFLQFHTKQSLGFLSPCKRPFDFVHSSGVYPGFKALTARTGESKTIKSKIFIVHTEDLIEAAPFPCGFKDRKKLWCELLLR